jgi:hypothetical protein
MAAVGKWQAYETNSIQRNLGNQKNAEEHETLKSLVSMP